MTSRPTLPAGWLLPGWRTRALLAVLVVLAWGDVRADTCAIVPGASEFTIEDLGRVVFEELRTDRAADIIQFGGGVCLEVAGERITIRADALEVTSVSTMPSVIGTAAEIRSGPWLLGAQSLEATTAQVRLEGATLVGQGVVGVAERIEISTDDGVLRARSISVATPTLRLVMGVAGFDGATLRGEEVVLSTCDCPPDEAGVRLEGSTVTYVFADGVIELGQGTLLVGQLRLPLPPHFTLSQEVLADLRPPLTLSRDVRRGWLLELAERTVEGGLVRADFAFSDARPPRARAYLRGRDGPVDVALVLAPGAADVRVGASFELGGGVDVRLAQRFASGLDASVQDAAVTLSMGTDRALSAVPAGALEARAEVTTALSAQQFDTRTVATPRVHTMVRVDGASPAHRLGVLRVRAEAGATAYALVPGGQRWLSMTPRWSVRFGVANVVLTHAYRAVWGETPFDAEVDAVAARHQTTLQVALQPESDLWRASTEVWYFWRPDDARPALGTGLTRLRVDARWRLGALAEGAVATSMAATVELAGWLAPFEGRDAFTRIGLDLIWLAASVELGFGATYSLVPEAHGLRSLTVSGSAPLRRDGSSVELQPYLALDVWPVLSGNGWPALRGHGLGLLWVSRYGTLDLGYRSEPDGSVTSSVAFRVEVREPRLEDLR